MTIKQAKDELRTLGVTLNKNVYGEYRVNISGSTESTAYYSGNLDDAYASGLAMGKCALESMAREAAFKLDYAISKLARGGRWLDARVAS